MDATQDSEFVHLAAVGGGGGGEVAELPVGSGGDAAGRLVNRHDRRGGDESIEERH